MVEREGVVRVRRGVQGGSKVGPEPQGGSKHGEQHLLHMILYADASVYNVRSHLAEMTVPLFLCACTVAMSWT